MGDMVLGCSTNVTKNIGFKKRLLAEFPSIVSALAGKTCTEVAMVASLSRRISVLVVIHGQMRL